MIDLHVHTTASDGDKRPKELVDYAIEKGIDVIAITDHDTIEGVEEAINYSKDKKIMVIPGIEFDAESKKGQIHILGLFIDYKDKNIQEKLKKVKDERNARNDKFIAEFNKIGFDITLDELKQVSNEEVIAKPHFAKVFLNKGYINKVEEIYTEYFNKSPFKEMIRMSYKPQEVIEIIKNANGIAILAHPHSLKLDDELLEEKIKEFVSYGLDGVECYHSNHTKEQMSKYVEIANKHNLLITKGSDYHGPVTKPDILLGRGLNENLVGCCNEDIIIEQLFNNKCTK